MHISTDRMNDIIREWVVAEIPKPAGGFETDEQQQDWTAASNRRFEQIVNMPEAAFKSLYHSKTGRAIGAMINDGSYNEIDDDMKPIMEPEDELAELRRQRDDLREALIELLDQADERHPHFESPRGTANRDKSRAALARCEEGGK